MSANGTTNKFSDHLVFLLVLLGASVLRALPSFEYDFWNGDVAEMLYHVAELRHGRVPYVDIYNHHFLGYLLPLRAFDLLVPLTGTSIKFLGILSNVAVAWLLYQTVLLLASQHTAKFAALVTATLGWLPGWDGLTYNVQTFLLPYFTLVIFLVVHAIMKQSERTFYFAAFTLGFLLSTDQRFIFSLVFLLLPPLFVENYRRSDVFLKCVGCVAVIPCACIFYLLWNGAIRDWYLATVVFPLSYRNRGLESSFFAQVFILVKNATFKEPLVSTLAIIGFCTLLAYERRAYIVALIIALIISGVSYALVGGRPYGNYLLMLTPLVMLFITLPLSILERSRLSSFTKKTPPLLVMLSCGIALSPALLYLHQHRPLGETIRPLAEVGTFVREHTDPEANILVWGYAPEIYLSSERFSGFNEIGLISVAGADFSSLEHGTQGIVPEREAAFQSYLAQTPPKMFLYYTRTDEGQGPGRLYQKNFDFRRARHLEYLKNFIDEHYELLRVFRYGSHVVEVYAKR